MRNPIIAFILMIAFVIPSYSASDTLIVNLKNGNAEKIPVSRIKKIQFENITSVDNKDIQYGTKLIKTDNYPNPFTEHTSIEFELVSSGNVDINIYDNEGKLVQKLECLECPSGKNSITWNCVDRNNNPVRSGIYYYEINFNNEKQLKKMILIK